MTMFFRDYDENILFFSFLDSVDTLFQVKQV